MGCNASGYRDKDGSDTVPAAQKTLPGVQAKPGAASEQISQVPPENGFESTTKGTSNLQAAPQDANQKSDGSDIEQRDAAKDGDINSLSNLSAKVKTLDDLNAMDPDPPSEFKQMPPEIETYVQAYPIIGELSRQLDEWERKLEQQNIPERSPVRSTQSSRPTSPPGIVSGVERKRRRGSRSKGERTERPEKDAVLSVTSISTHLSYEPQGTQSFAEPAPSDGLDTPRRPGSPTSVRRPNSPSAMSKSTCNFIHEVALNPSVAIQPASIQDLFVRILGDPSKNETCPWTLRCKAMASIREICCDTKTLKPEKFQNLFAALVGSILLQLTDRRSQVCRMFCAEIEAIVATRKSLFLPFAPIMLKPLCALTKVTKKVMADSASKLAFRIIHVVGDDQDHSVFRTLEGACQDKAKYVRREAFRMIQEMLKAHYNIEKIQGSTLASEHLDQILTIVQNGLDDSDAKARSESVRVLVVLTRVAKASPRENEETDPSFSRPPPSPGTPCGNEDAHNIKSSIERPEVKTSPEKASGLEDECNHGEAYKTIIKFIKKMPGILLRKYEDTMTGVAEDTPHSSPIGSPKGSSIGSPKLKRARARKSKLGKTTASGKGNSSRRAKSATKASRSKRGPSRMKDFLKQKRREAKKLGTPDLEFTVAAPSQDKATISKDMPAESQATKLGQPKESAEKSQAIQDLGPETSKPLPREQKENSVTSSNQV